MVFTIYFDKHFLLLALTFVNNCISNACFELECKQVQVIGRRQIRELQCEIGDLHSFNVKLFVLSVDSSLHPLGVQDEHKADGSIEQNNYPRDGHSACLEAKRWELDFVR